MRNLLLIFFAVLLAALLDSSPTRAAFETCQWSSQDRGQLQDYALLLAADYASTLYFLRHGGAERNSILGEHPSTARLTAGVALAGVAVVGGSCLLSGEWRHAWHAVWITVEAVAVFNNIIIAHGPFFQVSVSF